MNTGGRYILLGSMVPILALVLVVLFGSIHYTDRSDEAPATGDTFTHGEPVLQYNGDRISHE